MKYTQFNPRPYEAHMVVYNLMAPHSQVLDLGCATGYMARELLKKHCSITGIDVEKGAVDLAKKYCKETYVADLEKPESLKLKPLSFDYVLLLDVVEHLKNRENLLAYVKKYLKPNGKLILSTPNIAHVSIRLKLLSGNFTYAEYGILDKTHIHLFTKSTLAELLISCGYDIDVWQASCDFGQLPGGRILREIPKGMQHIVTDMAPTLLAVQWIVVCSL